MVYFNVVLITWSLFYSWKLIAAAVSGGGGEGGGEIKDHPEDQVLSKLHVVYQQLQANQKSQQDEIENRLKEIQKEVKAWTCTPETCVEIERWDI